MLTNDDRPNIEEQYSQACTSSNLRVQAEKRSSADVLIASGMSNSRIGGALMRLRSEYGSDSVPRRNASATDHRLMMGRLKTLPAVLQAVTSQAHRWGIDRPEAVALAVVSHWLDNICRHCEGRGKERIKDTPTLSGKNCKHCRGTGRIDLTHGSAGRRVEGFIEDCINRWRQTTAKRLFETR
jgi:hypothetical protein